MEDVSCGELKTIGGKVSIDYESEYYRQIIIIKTLKCENEELKTALVRIALKL